MLKTGFIEALPSCHSDKFASVMGVNYNIWPCQVTMATNIAMGVYNLIG